MRTFVCVETPPCPGATATGVSLHLLVGNVILHLLAYSSSFREAWPANSYEQVRFYSMPTSTPRQRSVGGSHSTQPVRCSSWAQALVATISLRWPSSGA